MGEPVLFATAEVLEARIGPDRTGRVIASTETRHRDGRRIMQAGWDLTRYRVNPVVLWDHGNDPTVGTMPVARGLDLQVETINGRPALVGTLAWADHAAAKVVRAGWESGLLNTTSVGWRALETPQAAHDAEGSVVGLDYPRSELLEWSVVPVPSNPDAVRLAASLELELPMTLTRAAARLRFNRARASARTPKRATP